MVGITILGERVSLPRDPLDVLLHAACTTPNYKLENKLCFQRKSTNTLHLSKKQRYKGKTLLSQEVEWQATMKFHTSTRYTLLQACFYPVHQCPIKDYSNGGCCRAMTRARGKETQSVRLGQREYCGTRAEPEINTSNDNSDL